MSLKHLTALLPGIVLLACATAAQACVFPGGNGTGPQTYAILVGSGAPLSGVADAVRGDLDVDHVAADFWASNVAVLKYQWDSPNTVAGDIQSAAGNIAAVIKPGDSFVFYYSGHGTGGSGEGVQDFINPVQGAGYQDNSLAGVFADSHFTDVKKFFLIDSCHSEGMWKNDSAGDFDLESLKNISFLASSAEDGVAFSDASKTGTSFFTNAILPALTPNATFGSLLASAMAGSGSEISGFFKDDGHGTGILQAVGYTSGDFDWNATLGNPVPEPATWMLLFVGAAAFSVRRRRNG